MSDSPPRSPGSFLGILGLFVLLGVPMVAYLWETLNQVLALHFDPRRLLLSLPILAAFVALLVVVGRRLGS